MRAHDVDHRVTAKFPKVIGANHSVVMAFPYVIDAGFKLDQIVNIGMPFCRPIHSTNDTAERELSGSIATGDLFERMEHPILIELSLAKVCFNVSSKLELASTLRCFWVNPCRDQPLEVFAPLVRVDDVNCLVAAFESILNKGEKYPILFVVAVKECANVAGFCELGTRKRNGSRGLHNSPPKVGCTKRVGFHTIAVRGTVQLF